jgi:hypothetical protein
VLAVFANPLFLRTASLFHPVVFDQLWWTLAFYGLLRIGQVDEPRWWVLLGAAGGLGLLTKFSIGVPAVGIGLALVASRHRGALATRWPWVGLAIALLIGSPSIVGQIRLGWPVLGQMSDLRTSQFVHVTVGNFLAYQLFYGPGTILGLIGVIALLRRHDLAWARPVGVATLASFLLVLVLGGKAYYVGPVYPVLCAAGAVTLERWSFPAARPVRWGLAALLTLYGVGILPLGVPLLPPDPMSRYAQWLFGGEALKTNWGGVEPVSGGPAGRGRRGGQLRPGWRAGLLRSPGGPARADQHRRLLLVLRPRPETRARRDRGGRRPGGPGEVLRGHPAGRAVHPPVDGVGGARRHDLGVPTAEGNAAGGLAVVAGAAVRSRGH